MKVSDCDRLFRREGGRLFWADVSKFHISLNGREAGGPQANHNGKRYWVVRVGGKGLKRSRIIFAMTRGRWPALQIDHIDGDSLNDEPSNLREATQQQNSWNHKTRRKASPLPMGVRQLQSGRFLARLCGRSISVHESAESASSAYLAARKEAFGEFA